MQKTQRKSYNKNNNEKLLKTIRGLYNNVLLNIDVGTFYCINLNFKSYISCFHIKI